MRRCFISNGATISFFKPGISGQAGQGIENDGDFLGQLAGSLVSKTEVGVNPRGARMVIAGAEMDVLPQPIGIAPNDEERFAMRFQSDHAVNDVRARFLEPARPLNVGRFVEPRAQVRPSR